jgi:undecaprenyl-diphosphatase
MNHLWLNAALNGVLEGLTEFLPISSTGHLILVRDWLPLEVAGDAARRKAFADAFDIVIQLPAILAIVALYRQRLWRAARGAIADAAARRFWIGLFAAFLPAAIVGFLAHHWIEAKLFTPRVVATALVLGGLAILAVERWSGAGGAAPAEETPLKTCVGIGLFQCLSLVPGTSRSAATIIGARLQGLGREAAAEYSFFLALPTMFAATVYKLLSAWTTIQWTTDGAPLAIGCVTSFVTAYLVVAWFMRYLRTRTLALFAWYRLALAAAVLLFAA